MFTILDSSYFLIKSDLKISPKSIALLSKSNEKYNKESVKALSRQISNTKTGLMLTLLSAFSQFVGSYQSTELKGAGFVFESLMFAFFIAFVIHSSCEYLSHFYARIIYYQTTIYISQNFDKQ